MQRRIQLRRGIAQCTHKHMQRQRSAQAHGRSGNRIHASSHQGFEHQGGHGLAQRGGQAQGNTHQQTPPGFLPDVLLGIAASPQHSHHHASDQEDAAHQRSAPEGFSQKPPSQERGEQGVAGKQHAAAAWPQAVHAGKQGGVADANADEAGQRQEHGIRPGQRTPAPTDTNGYPQHGTGKHQPPAVESKRAHTRSGAGREQAADSPAQGGGQGQQFGTEQASCPRPSSGSRGWSPPIWPRTHRHLRPRR